MPFRNRFGNRLLAFQRQQGLNSTPITQSRRNADAAVENSTREPLTPFVGVCETFDHAERFGLPLLIVAGLLVLSVWVAYSDFDAATATRPAVAEVAR